MIKIEKNFPLPDRLQRDNKANRKELEEVLAKMEIGDSFVIRRHRVKTVRKIAKELGITIAESALDPCRKKARVFRVGRSPVIRLSSAA
jgi:hypothetical protein